MAKAAIRKGFETILVGERNFDLFSGKRHLHIIVGKGGKLLPAVKSQLEEEFHPGIRCTILSTNSGRLVVNSFDAIKWLSQNKNSAR